MGKRRTYPGYLSKEEHEREQERVKSMVEGITGVRVDEKMTPLASPSRSEESLGDLRSRQPKASFRIRLSETDNLQLAIWSGKKDPDSEVIVATIQRRQKNGWKRIGRIAVYRSSDGTFSQLPERK